MIPRVALRGHSFKGAGQYYLHDKGAETSERVEWTHTHNLVTNDPEKAFRYMAWTAMNAEQLKANSGVARTGRKATAGPVYSFSLAWHPEQKPEKEEMMRGAFDTLEGLGLIEHEAVMVAHNETEHPHVHVICNLVHPETGKRAIPSYDYLTLSNWAEDKEIEGGKIYCEQRVKNNERRRREAKKDRELALIKHRSEKAARAQEIKELYERSDSGKAFRAGLEEAGYALAKGDKRGYVLVNESGDIFSLSRQLKGQRAKDIKGRLADIDQNTLPQAKTLSDERKHFYRDDYEAKWQNNLVDDAIEADKDKREQQRFARTYKSYAANLDPILKRERAEDRKRREKELELDRFYKIKQQKAKLRKLHEEAKKYEKGLKKSVLYKSKRDTLSREISALQKSVKDAELRKQQALDALEKQIERDRAKNAANENKAHLKKNHEKDKSQERGSSRQRNKGGPSLGL